MFLHLSEVVGVVAVDALIIRKALNPVHDHGNLLLQDRQDDVSVAFRELISQVCKLDAHLGILAADLHPDRCAIEMLDGVWEPPHL